MAIYVSTASALLNAVSVIVVPDVPRGVAGGQESAEHQLALSRLRWIGSAPGTCPVSGSSGVLNEQPGVGPSFCMSIPSNLRTLVHIADLPEGFPELPTDVR